MSASIEMLKTLKGVDGESAPIVLNFDFVVGREPVEIATPHAISVVEGREPADEAPTEEISLYFNEADWGY